jgi:succinate dehydrogenase / fumarate reductase, cytochrome b subunit
MRWLIEFVKSSIGSKVLMALSGIGLVLFAIMHMLANLQVYSGPDAINGYAKSLRLFGPWLWVARGGLLLLALVHIGTAASLVVRNRRARPERYRYEDYRTTTFAARTMAVGGTVLLVYLIYHLSHFTFQVTDPAYQTFVDDLGRHDVYRMVVTGFSKKWVSFFYIFAVAVLCAHLAHGIPSFLQTLGLRHPRYTPTLNTLGVTIAVLLFVGYAAVPVGVMAEWVTLGGS